MSLAPMVAALARGPGRSRHLTMAEAEEAMRLVLAGDAEPEAVGALLMLMRYRGESAEEVAGLVRGLRAALPRWPGPAPALDWPSYAAGRTRGAPWFLLAARLVAMAGGPVLLHGWNSHQGARADVRAALPHAGIRVARGVAEAGAILARDRIAYLPAEAALPQLVDLLRLRSVLGLRSPLNTAARALNPGGAPASVQGVFHPPYRALAAEAAALLGLPRLAVLKGGGGEFERHPGKPTQIDGRRDGAPFAAELPPLAEAHRRLAEDDHGPDALAALWSGALADPFAEAVVLGTAALALDAAGIDADPVALWARRTRTEAA
ncbi:glycosyl transferase family protein [Jannaschia sp. Os4]|uniref:glycosyl transferase family protein n=1 Tax=Jannaschia sp. Os4 TaxID=2807617 RepID=UPI00193A2511|nr:glycosyl transferase family protein [Jannaschia sp. Os4]MBM2576366.1 glycosyl transferase family protein [Jannaschia sp. Os4]